MKRLFFIVPYLLNNLLIGQYNMSNGALFTCSGTFYDSGGASGNYSDDENYVFTFYPGFWGSIVEISFTSYNSGSTDTISIFDGPDNSYPLLFSGGGNLSIPNLHSSDVTGALTIQFNSDATGNEFGWEAEIYCCMAAQYWYIDLDNDGFGSTSDFVFGCAPPSGYVANNDDCDDNSIMYEDLDGDGFGGNWQAGCGSYNSLDCSDNLLTYEDNDGDNYGNFEIFAPCGTTDNTDCNDLDDQINPGMSEISGNGMDDNCDGYTDPVASIEESTEFEFVLFPNPAKEEVNILLNTNENNLLLEIFSMNGQLELSTYQSNSGLLKLKTDEFIPGVYLLKITTESNSGIGRLVIE